MGVSPKEKSGPDLAHTDEMAWQNSIGVGGCDFCQGMMSFVSFSKVSA